MRRLICLSLLVLFSALPNVAGPDEVSAVEPWALLGARCEQHDHLSQLVGTWDAKVTIYTLPGAPPESATGTAEITEILGGRFVQTEFSGQFKGQKIEGLGINGYDRMKERFVGVWMDTLGTMIFSFEGECDEQGKVRTMIGQYDIPRLGDRRRTKTVTTVIDADCFRFESFDLDPEGLEHKSFEILYTRR